MNGDENTKNPADPAPAANENTAPEGRDAAPMLTSALPWKRRSRN